MRIKITTIILTVLLTGCVSSPFDESSYIDINFDVRWDGCNEFNEFDEHVPLPSYC